MSRFLPFILFVVFCILAVVSLMRLESPAATTSPWVGHTLPQVEAVLLGKEAPEALFHERVTVLNIFASWCAPCVAEHPLLVRLKKETDADIVAIAWNDTLPAIDGFLKEHGNPYTRVYTDPAGTSALALGIRGVPETFVIDAKGVIRFHYPGPLTEMQLKNELLPLIRQLKEQENAR